VSFTSGPYLLSHNANQNVFCICAAHLHHAYESYVQNGKTQEALKQSLLVSTIQLAYTSVFGWYANFLFLRTGSLLSPFIAHVFCNIAGLPNPVEAAQEYPNRKWRKFDRLNEDIYLCAADYHLFCP
jgi:membrane protease YdiL (CAAX protease family)